MYLEDEFGISVRNLKEHAESFPVQVRGALQEIWYQAKERRGFPEILRRLVNHDVECYLGVAGLRKQEGRSALGFNSWWLTYDHIAFNASRILEAHEGGEAIYSPAMSPDFLLRYLDIGPVRDRLNSEDRDKLPLVMDVSFLEGVSEQVLMAAERIRQENIDAPQRVIQRKIRDGMNAMKGQLGVTAVGGFDAVETQILEALSAREKPS